jgi:trans-2,3-dihydro-3-hydroxyanthranilate isomerase
MKEDFASFSNLITTDFDPRFNVQEVSTGSAFVIVPLKSKRLYTRFNWMKKNSKVVKF